MANTPRYEPNYGAVQRLAQQTPAAPSSNSWAQGEALQRAPTTPMWQQSAASARQERQVAPAAAAYQNPLGGRSTQDNPLNAYPSVQAFRQQNPNAKESAAAGMGLAAASNAQREGTKRSQQWASMDRRPTSTELNASVGPNSRLVGEERLRAMSPVQGNYQPNELERSYLDKGEVIRDLTPRYSQLTKKNIFGGYNPNPAEGEASYTFSDRYQGATRMGANEIFAREGQGVDGARFSGGQLPNTGAATDALVSATADGRANAPLRQADDLLDAAKRQYGQPYDPGLQVRGDDRQMYSVGFNNPAPNPVDFLRGVVGDIPSPQQQTYAALPSSEKSNQVIRGSAIQEQLKKALNYQELMRNGNYGQ